MVLVLTVVILQSISFANYALTTKTTNIIYGSAPYLTFDGGRTRVTNTEALLGISLSDGRAFTPTTNNSSSTNPIVLPVTGQSFNDIGMLVPRNTDSIALSSLIRTPYNYWGDDDGDGQGIDGVTATGSLKLSIVNKWNLVVARNEVLDICRAPYKLTLSNDGGILKTRYGVPNESRFSASNVTYYINPNPNISSPVICFAIPLSSNTNGFIVPASIWDWRDKNGFLTQSVTPSSYGSNFPTTGANNLYFDLDIVGNNQALSWAPVSHGGITATMTNSTSTSVRVTLTGPAVTDRNQWESDNPGRINRISLPQTFELVGRDSSGNAVVKYGFKLKQWFVNRGDSYNKSYSNTNSWCSRIGYRLVNVKDLTNANCDSPCISAKPSPWVNYSAHHIGAGFFTEWGDMGNYTGANFSRKYYWTSDDTSYNNLYTVYSFDGNIFFGYRDNSNNDNRYKPYGLCVYP
ncbi:hypothetical protein [Gilliamella apis]|uniref:hypothetical protein n=1 Tax=Gilliamella apis TaxID=1970738 RepID=UPI000D78A047|nr:hypothetical protein [Gilliamella apis]PXY92400.1 hypothetical protein DKK77_08200 [Gilliamella apis]WLS97037.1 hypothetical protein RAM03_04015 [Gilliamella apis]